MLAIHQQLNSDESQEPGELGKVNAALPSLKKHQQWISFGI